MPREVTVYSTPFCIACEELMTYLHQRGIPFRVRDVLVDDEAAEALEAQGLYSTPALQVDGQFADGMDRARVEALLES